MTSYNISMKRAEFRFYEELNDFLPKQHRRVGFFHEFEGEPSVIELIEKLGVPHSAVDLILVNGEVVDFTYRIKDQDRVAVYPVFESIDISPINRLRPQALRKTSFILDVHLGRLTKYLRICGFDCYYANLEDNEIITLALQQERIILTKDRALLKDKRVTHGYWVRADEPKKQLLEIIKRFDLLDKINFLTRCLLCNHLLQKIAKEEVQDRVPTHTTDYYQNYFVCPHCNKIFWEGSHYKNMAELVEFIHDTLRGDDRK